MSCIKVMQVSLVAWGKRALLEQRSEIVEITQSGTHVLISYDIQYFVTSLIIESYNNYHGQSGKFVQIIRTSADMYKKTGPLDKSL